MNPETGKDFLWLSPLKTVIFNGISRVGKGASRSGISATSRTRSIPISQCPPLGAGRSRHALGQSRPSPCAIAVSVVGAPDLAAKLDLLALMPRRLAGEKRR